MEWEKKESIQCIFKSLGINETDVCQWLEIYYACRLLIGMKRENETYSSHIIDVTFSRLYNLYGFSFPPLFSQDFKNFCDITDHLCRVLTENSLHETRKFLNEFLPFAVQNQSEYFALFSAKRSRVLELVTLLTLIKFSQTLSVEDLISSNIDDIYLRFSRENSTELLDNLHLDQEHFSACWRAIFACSIRNIPVKINGNITKAMQRYRREKMPLKHLLQDVHDIKLHRKDLEHALNPWLHLNRDLKRIPVESGFTIEETLFEKTAFLLKDEQPTDLIRSIFYPPSRNDSGIECGLVYEKFADQIVSSNSILVINPSPEILLKWSDDVRFQSKNIYFACVDLTIANLYRFQFPTATFLSFDSISSLKQVDSVLILGRDLNETVLKRVLDSLQIAIDESLILALLPSRIINSSSFGFRILLEKCHCKLERILLIPSNATKSFPRQKSLLYIRKDNKNYNGESSIALYESICNNESNLYTRQVYSAIPRPLFNAGNLTLKQLSKQSSESFHLTKKSRNPPEPYQFSKEITLYYTIQENKKGSFAGKAYYCETLSKGENNHRKRGKRLTDMIEKGLRSKSREGVFLGLELVPFDPRAGRKIIDDINNFYGDSKISLTLKTVWFCCRPRLLAINAYNDDTAKRLFCSESKGLGELIPAVSSEGDFQEKMSSIFNAEWENVPLKYWSQLDLVLRTAIQEGYFYQNPITSILPYLSNRASQEQREVRNALTKKSFTLEEEKRMIDYIAAPAKAAIGSRRTPRYVSESRFLAGAIRFFTGMNPREVCALEWRDFIRISGTNSYQLIVSKFVSEQGKILSHTEREDWKRFRRVPLPSALAAMLLNRKQFLLAHGLEAEQLKELPIIQKSEFTELPPMEQLYCTPKDINKICKIIIEQANISQQMLLLPGTQGSKEVDIYKYQGDIFQSNFKYHANHTCGLTRGELSYILGNTPPDTFSRHYCDYTNDLIQYAISVKLQRWASIFEDFSVQESTPQSSNGFIKKKHCVSATASNGEVPCIDIILEASSPSSLTVSLEHEFGCSGSYTVYKKDGVQS